MNEAYIVAWNEADTIEFSIKHYQSFAHVILLDNHSDDGTPDIARKMGCEVRTFGIKGLLSDAEYVRIKNNVWKGSRADWVIVVDCDEILYHKNIQQVLKESKGTIFNTQGWQVFSKTYPRDSWLELTDGFPDDNYSKTVIWRPQALTEINYVFGCHVARPKGKLSYGSEVLTLFHYRNIGGPDRLVERHKKYRSRLSEHNKKWGLGIHYTYDDERRILEWNQQFLKSRGYSPPGTL